MKRLVGLLLAAAAGVYAGNCPVWGQEPSPSVRMEVTLSRRPPRAPQLPDPKVVERDTEEAVAAIKARERREEVMRETLRAPSRRPDLNYDVWSGIQSRNINDALRRR